MSIKERLLDRLRLPETEHLGDLDTPETTALHARIIAQKPYLTKIYLDWYRRIQKDLPTDFTNKTIIEIGSGGGFIKDILPQILTSETVPAAGVDLRFSALDMPFDPESVDAFILIDVFHHIPNAQSFFTEAQRCLKPGGRIVMIEPANTAWGRFVYRRFHHEPFDPDGEWSFAQSGRLTAANGALPWIIFHRDRDRFEQEFPALKILKLKPHMPFLYLISGGVSMCQLLPSFTFNMIKGLEKILSPLNKFLGMFLTVVLEKSGPHQIGDA